MSADDAGLHDGSDGRVIMLVGQLGESRSEVALDPARIVARARRQRAALAVLQLLVALAGAVPDAFSVGRRARR